MVALAHTGTTPPLVVGEPLHPRPDLLHDPRQPRVVPVHVAGRDRELLDRQHLAAPRAQEPLHDQRRVRAPEGELREQERLGAHELGRDVVERPVERVPDLEELQARRVRVEQAEELVRVPEVDVVDAQRAHAGQRQQHRAYLGGDVAPAEQLQEDVVDRGNGEDVREERDELGEPEVVGVAGFDRPGAKAAVQVQLPEVGEDGVGAEDFEEAGEVEAGLEVEAVEAKLAHGAAPVATDKGENRE